MGFLFLFFLALRERTSENFSKTCENQEKAQRCQQECLGQPISSSLSRRGSPCLLGLIQSTLSTGPWTTWRLGFKDLKLRSEGSEQLLRQCMSKKILPRQLKVKLLARVMVKAMGKL